MKKKIFLSFFIVIFTLFYSCTSYYYQVYDVQSVTNNMNYSDDLCEITYDFWREGGDMSFWFKNNSDKDIFIDMSRTFYVQNGVAYNYFTNKIDGTSRSYNVYNNSMTTLYYNDFFSTEVSKNTNSGLAVNSSNYYIENKIICVPAKTSKHISCKYSIYERIYRNCNMVLYPKEMSNYETPNSPKIANNVYSEFSKETSPIHFGNIITYYTDSPNECVRVTNDFYISKITNYKDTHIIKYNDKVTICEKEYPLYGSFFNINTTNRFYNAYTNGIQTYDSH